MSACQVKRMKRNELNGIPRPWPQLDNKYTRTHYTKHTRTHYLRKVPDAHMDNIASSRAHVGAKKSVKNFTPHPDHPPHHYKTKFY